MRTLCLNFNVEVHDVVRLNLRLYLCFDESINIILSGLFSFKVIFDDNQLKTNIIRQCFVFKLSALFLYFLLSSRFFY